MVRTSKYGLFLGCSAAAFTLAMFACVPARAAPQDDSKATTDQTTLDQDTSTGDQDQKAEDQGIVVTGTNISGVKPVGSESISLDRAAIVASGMTTAADVVRTLPQVRNLGEYREGGTYGGNNSQQGNAINLRGLGAAATLVLVDGHRVVPTGASANFTEANQVPLAALQRIEVITDGASAIYGSDAVAGVINYVVRKDFDGVETSFRLSNNTGAAEYSPAITAGTHWSLGGLGNGNIIVSYEYTHRDPLLRGKNPWLRDDLRPVGGPDLRFSGTPSAGNPGNILVNTGANNTTLPLAGTNTYYGLPAGPGTGLTVADLKLNQPNFIDSSDFTDYTGRLERHHVSAFFNQDLGDSISIFAQGTYSHRHTYSRQIRSFLGAIENVTVPQYLYNPTTNVVDCSRPNPAWIPGIPGVATVACNPTPPPGLPAVATLNAQYNFYSSVGYNNWDNTVEDYNVTGGIRANLPMGWKGEAYVTYGYDDACNFCVLGTNINPDSLQYMINTGEVNPFNSNYQLTPSQKARLYGDNIQASGNEFKDWVAKFDGPLFDLPGGTIRAAIGGEISDLANWNLNGRNKGINNVLVIDTDKARSIGTRTIKSIYGELYVPLIGEEMDLGFIRSLVVDGAVRYDDYSDVGSTTNPKIGVTAEFGDILTLRGSWGTSFRAPGLPDVNPFAISGAVVASNIPINNPNVDGCGSGFCFTTAAVVAGANPNIKPETATNWSLGGDFKPIKNLRISGTYYNIKYSNRIGGLSYGFLFGGPAIFPGYPTYSGYADYVHPIHNTATGPNSCTIDPVLQAYLNRPILYGTTLINPCTITILFDGRNVNLAATQQSGIDAQIDYMVPITDGAILFNASVNKVLTNKQQVTPGAAFVDVKGRADQPVEWRGRGSIGAIWRGFNATLFANYVGSYDNYGAVNPLTNASLGIVRVKSWTTFDLNLGYSTQLQGGFLKSVRVSVNIQNITDEDPPLMVTANGAFNPAYSNPFGRTATMQLSTSF